MVIVVRTDMAAVCKYCVVITVAVSAIFLSSQQADAQWVYMHACNIISGLPVWQLLRAWTLLSYCCIHSTMDTASDLMRRITACRVLSSHSQLKNGSVYMLSVRAFSQFTPLAHVWVTPPGWQKLVGSMENSSYFESLEAKAKELYREKLSYVCLSI